MDISSILLIVGAIVLAAVLVWAAVAVVGMVFFRKTAKDMRADFDKGFDSDFFKSRR